MAKDASAAAAIDEDPKTDLISQIPEGYSERLSNRKSQAEKSAGQGHNPRLAYYCSPNT
jgi:hypothetical protein